MIHTPEQLANWEKYERVRRRGTFNMLDPRAREMSDLDKDAYAYCIEHYDSLRRQVKGKGGGHQE